MTENGYQPTKGNLDKSKPPRQGSGVPSQIPYWVKSIESKELLNGELPPTPRRPPRQKAVPKHDIIFTEVRDLSYAAAKDEIEKYISECEHAPSMSEMAEELNLDIDMIARVCLARKIPTFDNNSVVDGVGNSPVIPRRPQKRQSKTTFNTEGVEVIRRTVKKIGSGAHATLPKEWLDETVVIIRTGE